jgi:prophage regulatory protein
MANTVLRLPKVITKSGLSRSAIYQRIADGSFPKAIRLGGQGSRAVGWLESDIECWLEERVCEMRSGPSKSAGDQHE